MKDKILKYMDVLQVWAANGVSVVLSPENIQVFVTVFAVSLSSAYTAWKWYWSYQDRKRKEAEKKAS